MKALTSTQHRQLAHDALAIGMRLRDMLARLNLQDELIRRAYVVKQHGMTVVFYPLELAYLEGKLTSYQQSLHQLSTYIRKPMAISNSRGFRYAVLLQKPKRLPIKWI